MGERFGINYPSAFLKMLKFQHSKCSKITRVIYPKNRLWLLVNHTKPSNTLFETNILTGGNYKSRSRQLQSNTVNGVMAITINCVISTSNHMFKRKIWDKFTEFTFLKFCEGDFKISKNERDKFSPNFTNNHVIPG